MKVRAVLVRPRNPLNIGAAARAMANFGVDDMVVVRPWAPVWKETVSAVGAERLVLAAKAVNSLEEATRDCALVLGTTVVRDRHAERDVVRLPDLPEYLRKRKVGGDDRIALVFGPEKTGLSNAYLEKCHAWLTVPTDAATPSMNLSHAVAVCCYELSRTDAGRGARGRNVAQASAGEVDLLAKHALKLFEKANYLSFISPARKMSKIRRALMQWNVREMDVRLLHGIMRFLETKAGGREG